jgi:chemotaxis protein CheD
MLKNTSSHAYKIYTKALEHKAVVIHPGQIEVQQHLPISTLLGSCVSICLYDAHLHIAGMNHFMLPHFRDREKNSKDSVYSGMASMDMLVNAMMKHGAVKSRLVAKAFGGGNMLKLRQHECVGQCNIHFTQEWLAAEKIPLIAADWGGYCARKIIFEPQTGYVYCRHIQNKLVQRSSLSQEEPCYENSLKTALKKPKVDYW